MPDPALPRTGLAVLKSDGSDSTTEYRVDIRAIAAFLEASGLVWRGQGLLSARPSASIQGGLYKATDSGQETILYYDDGSTWRTIGASATVDDLQGVGSLRTLGAGHQQAAPGDHGHSYVPLSTVTTKGDLVAATGSAAVTRVGVGSNGQILTADSTASGGVSWGTPSGKVVYAVKASQTSRSSTTTVSADPDLQLSLTAGTWLAVQELSFVESSSNTQGIKYQWAVSANFTSNGSGIEIIWDAGGNGRIGQTVDPIAAPTTFTGGVTSGVTFLVRLQAQVVVSGACTLSFQWAQASSSSNATILRAGSQFWAQKIS